MEVKAPLLLLSTCGTSVLTKEAVAEDNRWLIQIANKRTLSGADADRLERFGACRSQRLLQARTEERRGLSAELNGISAVLDRWTPRQTLHLLVHTDTVAGEMAAEIVEAVLRKDGQQVELLTAPGLRTDDFPAFREALADLTKQLEEWIPKYRERGWTTLFNLTGGFKSVNAYLQAVGMLYADRCVFLFEGASTLMEIPRLPVRLAEADELRPHRRMFRRLDHGYVVTEIEAFDVPDSLLMTVDGQAASSIWGAVVWGRVRKTLLAEELLEPLSSKLIIRDSVRRTFDKLPHERRIQVNDGLDALSAYLDHNREPPKSNTFKPIGGIRCLRQPTRCMCGAMVQRDDCLGISMEIASPLICSILTSECEGEL